MILLKPTLDDDLREIAAWIGQDPFHKEQAADWWLTGTVCLFAAKVVDKIGTFAYAKVEEEGDGYRLHSQFPPEETVSKLRIAKGTIEFVRMLASVARQNGKKFIITESENPPLVGFLKKLGFKEAAANNEWQLSMEQVCADPQHLRKT